MCQKSTPTETHTVGSWPNQAGPAELGCPRMFADRQFDACVWTCTRTSGQLCADAQLDACATESRIKRSELDKLLDISLTAGKPVKIGKATPKKKTAPTAVAAPKTPVVKSVLKKPAASESLLVFTAHSPPKIGTPCPFIFLGCKVLCTSTAYRVFPKPGQSVYDKSFKHISDKTAAFKAMIEFCKKPSIPKDSKHYVK